MARAGTLSMREACRRFGVSPTTGYLWAKRSAGLEGLGDRPRTPHTSPGRTPQAMEEQVCDVRRAHPRWGGRKIHHVLRKAGVANVPPPSTCSSILRRHDLIAPPERAQHAWQRFEYAAPNQLWQMDFKGHIAAGSGRCHPLTILDDHSRFNLCLAACADERSETVQKQLIAVYRRYGMPDAMLMDNGAPWGSDVQHQHTRLTTWMMRHGIRIAHGAPYHPQTQGKEERFHRTLKAEVLTERPQWHSCDELQRAFDDWRPVYNYGRPHESIGMAVPGDRYVPSARSYHETLPPIEYAPGDLVRKVQNHGRISVRGRTYRVGRAFIGEPVGLRPTTDDGIWDVYYCVHRITQVDLREPLP
jgi:transposase InsO family protein